MKTALLKNILIYNNINKCPNTTHNQEGFAKKFKIHFSHFLFYVVYVVFALYSRNFHVLILTMIYLPWSNQIIFKISRKWVKIIEINIWKRNSTVKNFPIRTEFRRKFNAFDQSFDQFYCLFFSVEFLFHIFISMVKILHLGLAAWDKIFHFFDFFK